MNSQLLICTPGAPLMLVIIQIFVCVPFIRLPPKDFRVEIDIQGLKESHRPKQIVAQMGYINSEQDRRRSAPAPSPTPLGNSGPGFAFHSLSSELSMP